MSGFTRNRMHNSSNPHQGEAKRVLCVCSAGLLRSPTAAWILGQEPWGYNTRAAGHEENYALIHADEVLYGWADLVVCMNEQQAETARKWVRKGVPVYALNVLDIYGYRDPGLVRIMKDEFNRLDI